MGVLGAGPAERLGKPIETIGDGGKLLDPGRVESCRVLAVLELKQAAAEVRQRIQDAAENKIEDGRESGVERDPDKGERGDVLPDLGDLVGVARDHHGAKVPDLRERNRPVARR